MNGYAFDTNPRGRKRAKYLTRDLHTRIEQLEARLQKMETAYVDLLHRDARQRAGLPMVDQQQVTYGVMR